MRPRISFLVMTNIWWYVKWTATCKLWYAGFRTKNHGLLLSLEQINSCCEMPRKGDYGMLKARLGWAGTQALALKPHLTVSLVCERHLRGCPREGCMSWYSGNRVLIRNPSEISGCLPGLEWHSVLFRGGEGCTEKCGLEPICDTRSLGRSAPLL